MRCDNHHQGTVSSASFQRVPAWSRWRRSRTDEDGTATPGGPDVRDGGLPVRGSSRLQRSGGPEREDPQGRAGA